MEGWLAIRVVLLLAPIGTSLLYPIVKHVLQAQNSLVGSVPVSSMVDIDRTVQMISSESQNSIVLKTLKSLKSLGGEILLCLALSQDFSFSGCLIPGADRRTNSLRAR
ncbi:hypothetical protein BTVI_100062 [Pitangus sulphuratus]|nr:hypothetical protein BTVI_100062 [Pitangus sulphuratus]